MSLSRFIRWPVRIGLTALSLTGAAALALGAMVATPLRQPPALASISKGVRKVDLSDLPDVQRFQARDGTELAYRVYEPAGAGSGRIALLVHGSAGSSFNMHAVGKALAAAGVRAVAVDIRGHGRSGTRGDVAYLGQLDDDLADTVDQLHQRWPGATLTMIGHSSGGGFTLRTAGGTNGTSFERYVLLAPFLDPFAPSSRPTDKAGWASADVPRIIALTVLHHLGLTAAEGLPAVAFAVPAGSALKATGRYSYRLLENFGAGLSYRHYLDAATRPIAVIAGADDELMVSEKYAEAMRRPGLEVTTTIVPGVDHMGVVAEPAALEAIVAAVRGGGKS